MLAEPVCYKESKVCLERQLGARIWRPPWAELVQNGGVHVLTRFVSMVHGACICTPVVYPSHGCLMATRPSPPMTAGKRGRTGSKMHFSPHRGIRLALCCQEPGITHCTQILLNIHTSSAVPTVLFFWIMQHDHWGVHQPHVADTAISSRYVSLAVRSTQICSGEIGNKVTRRVAPRVHAAEISSGQCAKPELISATRTRGARSRNVSVFGGNKFGWNGSGDGSAYVLRTRESVALLQSSHKSVAICTVVPWSRLMPHQSVVISRRLPPNGS